MEEEEKAVPSEVVVNSQSTVMIACPRSKGAWPLFPAQLIFEKGLKQHHAN